MPDFFLDYILTYPGTLNELTASFLEVAQRGGGNLLGWAHTIGRGGNASNMVAQLSKLGCEVVPIIETDELGRIVSNTSSRAWTFPMFGQQEQCPGQCPSRQSTRAGASTLW